MAHIAESKVHGVMDKLSLSNPFHRVVLQTGDSDNEALETSREGVPDVPRVSIKGLNFHAPPLMQLASIQRLISRLEYNHLPSTFFNLNKNRPLNRLVATAKEMLQESLPIRCLEATFLGIHLTQHLKTVERIPLAFKSYCRGKCYRHIVLVLLHDGAYGALGLSRRDDLMDKPLAYSSLADLLNEYTNAYKNNGHVLLSIKLGLYVSHDSTSTRVPCFRFMTVQLPRGEPVDSDPRVVSLLLRYQEMLPTISENYLDMISMSKMETAANNAAPASPQAGERPMPMPIGMDPDSSMGEEAQSDDEDNRFRINCILQSRSPFPVSAFSIKGSGPGGGGAVSSNMAQRLRTQVASERVASGQPRGRDANRSSQASRRSVVSTERRTSTAGGSSPGGAPKRRVATKPAARPIQL